MIDDARALADEGAYDRAIEALETMVQSPAVAVLVLRTLAPVYAERGRTADAIATWQRYIEATGSEEARLGLARTLLGAGRPEEALAVLADIPVASSAQRKVCGPRARPPWAAPGKPAPQWMTPWLGYRPNDPRGHGRGRRW